LYNRDVRRPQTIVTKDDVTQPTASANRQDRGTNDGLKAAGRREKTMTGRRNRNRRDLVNPMRSTAAALNPFLTGDVL
jgi:hypothetical protein